MRRETLVLCSFCNKTGKYADRLCCSAGLGKERYYICVECYRKKNSRGADWSDFLHMKKSKYGIYSTDTLSSSTLHVKILEGEIEKMRRRHAQN